MNATADEPKQETYEINTTLMETTFRIHGPSTTNKAQISHGTAFLMGKPTVENRDKAYYVLISAAHVFDDIAGDLATLTLRTKQADGSYAQVPFNIQLRTAGAPLYVRHPEVDVAALYVSMPNNLSFKLLPLDLLSSDEWLTRFEIHPGDELLCLGFPLFASSPSGFPILRSGKIASYPIVPTKQHKNILFDFRVFQGNSGGPVYFVDRNRTYGGSTHLGETIQFVVGLVTSQLNATYYDNRELQVAAIIPASFIVETLNLLPPSSPYK